MGVLPAARRYHEALMEQNVCVDAMDPREDLSRYALVIAPRLYCVDEAVAANLRGFVDQGGVLCLTPRSGVVDEYNTIFNEPAPGPLREIAGVEVDEYGALPEPVPLSDDAGELGGALEEAELWAEEVVPTTAQTLATYAAGWLKGTPAVTVNEFGKGKVVYIGTSLSGSSLDGFLSWLCRLAGVRPVLETPTGVRALERRGVDSRFLFLLNFGDEQQSVALGEEWSDAFTGEALTAAEVAPIDIRLLRREM